MNTASGNGAQTMKKVIVRLRGGLGNQLFCYAAGRRLAWANSAELVMDHITGFERDHLYLRSYMLDRFNVATRLASPSERLEPLGRYRRYLAKRVSRITPYHKRRYIEQEGINFDGRILALRFNGTLYLDGYWQSEGYFCDIENIIRQDLIMKPPVDDANREMAERIRESLNPVCVHMRWFSKTNAQSDYCDHNLSKDYYQKAMKQIHELVSTPCFFVFSEDIDAARQALGRFSDKIIFVGHNRGDEAAYADLFLMKQCRHFIIANSSFSWWGAWLGASKDKVVIAPDIYLTGIASWGFRGLLPEQWLLIPAGEKA